MDGFVLHMYYYHIFKENQPVRKTFPLYSECPGDLAQLHVGHVGEAYLQSYLTLGRRP